MSSEALKHKLIATYGKKCDLKEENSLSFGKWHSKGFVILHCFNKKFWVINIYFWGFELAATAITFTRPGGEHKIFLQTNS